MFLCVCVTVSTINTLFGVERALQHSCSLFWCVAHPFYSTQRAMLRSNAWIKITLQIILLSTICIQTLKDRLGLGVSCVAYEQKLVFLCHSKYIREAK